MVGDEDPTDIFNDLTRLRAEQRASGSASSPAPRRQRSPETFARIPHDRALALGRHKLSGTAWLVLIELDRMILKGRGRNPVHLASHNLRAAGVHGHFKTRALRQLERAGAVRIVERGRGKAPLIAHLWYPLTD
jgi:hypothetical protein